MKKAFALVLTLVMLLSAVPALAVEVSAPGVYPITNEKVTLNVWSGQLATFEDFETSEQNVWFEEFSGVDVVWTAANSSEKTEKFNLSIASPDRADVYLESISNDEVMLYAEDGVIIPLEDLIDEHTVYIKKLLDENPAVREQLTAPDGHIYQLVNFMYLAQEAVPKMWVYKPYLEAYTAATGKGKPVTTAEFKDMLIYFRDNDMNGNGKADEIPLTGTYHYGTDGQDPIYWLANCFVDVTAGIETYYMPNGEGGFNFVANTDEFRAALKYANELFDEKLLVEDTYVQDLFQFRLLTSVPKDSLTVCVAAAPYPYRLLTYNADPSYTQWTDWEVIEPLQRPDGTQHIAGRREFNVGARTFITSNCENPEVAIKWLDYWYSDEGRAWSNFYGQEGKHWEWADVPSFGGSDKSVKSLVEWGTTQNVYWAQGWGPNTYRTRADYDAKAAADTATDNQLMACLACDAYAPYVTYSTVPQIVWCEDQDLIDERTDLKTQLDPLVTEYVTNFIMGKLDVNDDAVWEAYKADLESKGLSRLVEVQGLYFYGEE
ncbi:MAG: hypothetical protein IJP04_12090 [Clostridia bacterium]|nr:hypothetical protein [Clostridia bacterium]